jgi:hypothetical protein
VSKGSSKPAKAAAPPHLRPTTASWYLAVLEGYECEPHHRMQLQIAAECWDRAARCREIIEREGEVSRFGDVKAHPLLAPERDARSGLLRALREARFGSATTTDSAAPAAAEKEQEDVRVPANRRISKTRDALSPGQELFLRGVAWPAEDRHTATMVILAPGFAKRWFIAGRTKPGATARLPDDSPSAAELWDHQGAPSTAEWIAKSPGSRPSPWWRFNAPIVRKDGEDDPHM